VNHLMRELAPLSEAAWEEIDTEARQRLSPQLGARGVVDWAGKGGWKRSAANLGRTAKLAGPPPGVSGPDLGGMGIRALQRQVLPLAEVRVPFVVDRVEMDNAERGALDIDLDDLARAASKMAEIENRAVFHGWPEAGFHGIVSGEPHKLPAEIQAYPAAVAHAIETLRCEGVEGPYALAVDPDGYTALAEATDDGYPLFEHLEKILGGKVAFVPGLDGAVVLSQRGGDFVLDVGQDIAVGYSHHDADTVTLYLEESFAFRLIEPDAAVTLSR
jgi:uncharacterized linocin/CFP29 family protein